MTAISEETYLNIKKPQLTSPQKILYGPSRQPLIVIGQFTGHFTHRNRIVQQPTYVVDGLKTNLLGLPTITALELAAGVNATAEANAEVQDRFPSVFQGLGNLGRSTKFVSRNELHHTLSSPQDTCHYRHTQRSKKSSIEWSPYG